MGTVRETIRELHVIKEQEHLKLPLSLLEGWVFLFHTILR